MRRNRHKTRGILLECFIGLIAICNNNREKPYVTKSNDTSSIRMESCFMLKTTLSLKIKILKVL